MSSLPASIGGYRIIARLGQGGMATVYRAEQLSLQREVALKVVSPQLAGNPDFDERFLREARAGALVNHPNVVACYDAGKVDGQLFMALELVCGGDLVQLLARSGGRLQEILALSLLRDAVQGLEAIEAAGLVHRDIKPANIFMNDKGVAKLADLGLVCFAMGDDRVTKPGTVMGTPAYIAPEQARGLADVDIRADIYSLGATLFHLLTGKPPFNADNPITTLVKVLNDPMPDPLSLRPDLSPAITAIIIKSTNKDRAGRHQSARQLREDVECALAGRALRHAKTQVITNADIKTARASPPTAPVTRQREATPPRTSVIDNQKTPPNATKTSVKTALSMAGAPARSNTATPSTPAAIHSSKINSDQMKLLIRRILIDPNGLKAAIALAPGASFPRFLLDQIIGASGVTYGIDTGSINEATRASDMPRRIILARGDAPAPGMTGRSVRGEEIPAVPDAVTITILDDHLSAVALTQPNTLITKEQLEPVMKQSGIRFGIDVKALHRLCEGPADAQGRLVIARGRAPKPGRCAGFHLLPAIANTTVDDLGQTREMQRMQPGTVIATWQDEQSGSAGMDILGRVIPIALIHSTTPDECVGEGTELSRDRSGQMVLRATRHGLCQQQEDGCIRLVGALEIAGDLGPDSPPIVTDDVVVIRGNVLAGACISSTSDVVILGDLADAKVTAGGSLEIHGNIGPGDMPLTVSGCVTAASSQVRKIMAGHLRISGEVRNCEILASGDVSVGRVVGGCLTAGGTIDIGIAGDKDGTTTEIWAGHNLSYAQQTELNQLEEKRLNNERGRLIAECRQIEAELGDTQQRSQRLSNSQFVRKDTLDHLKKKMDYLERNRAVIANASESSRHQLAHQRGMLRELGALGDDARASIRVTTVAHEGVVARLADVEPEILAEPRLHYRLGTA